MKGGKHFPGSFSGGSFQKRQRAEVVLEDDDERGAAGIAAIIKAVARTLQPQSTVAVWEATEADLITARAESPAVAA